jgi:hypothetical protein
MARKPKSTAQVEGVDGINADAFYKVKMAETEERKSGALKRGKTYELRGAIVLKLLDKVASYEPC